MTKTARLSFLLITVALVLIITGLHSVPNPDPAGTTTAKSRLPAFITDGDSQATAPSPSHPINTQKILLDVPYISQQDYPTGCESISAVMLLRYWGVDISVDEFIDGYLECGETRWENSQLIGPSPYDKFVGNPRESSGYGCYAPVIEKAYRNLLTNHQIQTLSGGDLEEVAIRYLDREIPVLIWATIDLENAYPTDEWINEANGSTVQWLANEHCMVLVGYDNDMYYCNDPYNDNGVQGYPRTLLEDRFRQMGRQALVILPQE